MSNMVGIIGIHEIKCEGKNRKESTTDMIFNATSSVLQNAGVDHNEIDTVVMAESDQVDGRLIGAMSFALPANAYGRDEIRVEEDGAFALALAYMRCLSGHFGTAIVVGWSMCSQTNLDIVTNKTFEPFYYRPFGLNWLTSHALQAQSYMNKFGISEEQAAKVTVKNRSNAVNNENAHLRTKVNIDEVLKSKYRCSPLRELNVPPSSDGACALILATEERIKKNNWPVIAWIKGVSWLNDTYYIGDKDMWKLSSLVTAAQRAYKMAGIKNPLKDIDVAEIYDITSYHELMEYEALGFCKEGEGGKLIDSGATSMGNELPVNPSGGMLSSNPYIAVGLYRIAEAALQVSGKAGKRQVPNAKTALAHGISGMGGQSNCVVILGKN